MVITATPSWTLGPSGLQGWNGATAFLQPAANINQLQSAAAITPQTRLVLTIVRTSAKPSVPVSKPRDNSTMMAPLYVKQPVVNAAYLTQLSAQANRNIPYGNYVISMSSTRQLMSQIKDYGGAALKGCVYSAGIMLAAAGVAVAVTAGAASLPAAGAVGEAYIAGAIGGTFTYWVDPPYDNSYIMDVYDGFNVK